MSSYTRVSDEKDARWHEIRHRIRMNNLRYLEERDRIKRAISNNDRCPHCGQPLDRQFSQS